LSLSGSDFRIEGRPEPEAGKEMIINTRSVSPVISDARISLIKGRDFSDRDKSDAPRLRSSTMRLVVSTFPARSNWQANLIRRQTVVDVNRRSNRRREALGSGFKRRSGGLLSLSSSVLAKMGIVVRTTSNPLSVAAAVKSQIQAMIKTFLSITQNHGKLLSRIHFRTTIHMLLLLVFAAVALVLALWYLRLIHTRSAATHEIGIRVAVGAQPRERVSNVIGQE